MSEAKFGEQAAPDQATNPAAAIARASNEVIRETSERLSAQAHEGARQASAAATAGADAALRSATCFSENIQDLTNAWAHYAEAVMRQTAEASRALIGCRSLADMFEVHSRLVQGNLQAFLDQSGKLAEIAGRIAMRPFEAMRQAHEGPPSG